MQCSTFVFQLLSQIFFIYETTPDSCSRQFLENGLLLLSLYHECTAEGEEDLYSYFIGLFFFCFALAAEKVCGDYTWIGVQTIAEKRDTQDILLREHGKRKRKENPNINICYHLHGWSACLLGWDKDLGHMGELAWQRRGSNIYMMKNTQVCRHSELLLLRWCK